MWGKFSRAGLCCNVYECIHNINSTHLFYRIYPCVKIVIYLNVKHYFVKSCSYHINLVLKSLRITS